MKQIIILLLMCIALGVSAQDTISQPDITEAERIIDKYSGKISNTISDIAKDLKGPAEEVFRGVSLVKNSLIYKSSNYSSGYK